MPNWLNTLYQNILTKQVNLLLVLFFAGLVVFSFQMANFRLDASSESLVLENDPSVATYREIKAKFGSDDFLFVTFSPSTELFSDHSIKILTSLKAQFEQINGIDSVTSMLDVPLFNVDGITLTNFGEKVYYLKPGTDLEKARIGFVSNPLYRDLLINADATTTALVLNLAPQPGYLDVSRAIEAHQKKAMLTQQEKTQLKELQRKRSALIEANGERNKQIIKLVRAVLASFKTDHELYIGGVPMIASDMIDFVRSDLVVFGFMVLAFIIGVLTLIFRQFAWVFIPLVCCFCTIIVTTSYLGLVRWPVTVISSNYVSLLLIMTMSITIHLCVRFQELKAEFPDADVRRLMLSTLNSMFLPCIYTSLTTIVAFGSLVTSDIRPVNDFGKMMIIGVSFSFVLSFLLLPTIVYSFLKDPKPPKKQLSFQKMTEWLAEFTDKHRAIITAVSIFIAVFSTSGLLFLSVDNRFIDYFKSDTEIHQGMKVIDQKLGGTTPLDIVLTRAAAEAYAARVLSGDVPASGDSKETKSDDTQPAETTDSSEENIGTEESSTDAAEAGTGTETEDEFADEFGDDSGGDEFGDEFSDEFEDEFGDEFGDDPALAGTAVFTPSIWFTPEGRDLVGEVHDYLDSLGETGKVLSLWTTNKLIELMNDRKPLNNFELTLLQKNFPEDFKGQLLNPYFHEGSDSVALAVRVIETNKDLKRSELIAKIENHLENELKIAPENYRLSGMLILYNNMLASLFDSQIKTLGTVFIAIVLMFTFLFRSIQVALIAILPNLLSALFILGSMGWFGIPLDMMTITIAAITIGIAVDNTIHYIYRFRKDFSDRGNYLQTMYYCHSSIGKAMYYTSLTIIFGFSILTLSNFIPTIYFGLFTSLAMAIALLANLTMLPLLLMKLKPFGPEKSGSTYDEPSNPAPEAPAAIPQEASPAPEDDQKPSA